MVGFWARISSRFTLWGLLISSPCLLSRNGRNMCLRVWRRMPRRWAVCHHSGMQTAFTNLCMIKCLFECLFQILNVADCVFECDKQAASSRLASDPNPDPPPFRPHPLIRRRWIHRPPHFMRHLPNPINVPWKWYFVSSTWEASPDCSHILKPTSDTNLSFKDQEEGGGLSACAGGSWLEVFWRHVTDAVCNDVGSG